MADEVTYHTLMNQPSHRPGMENVVNRAEQPDMPIMQSRDASGNETQSARPKVAPGRTDPFSIKGDPAPKAAPRAATPGDAEPAMGNKAGGDAIDDAVGKAQTG